MINDIDPQIIEQLRDCQFLSITTIDNYLQSDSTGSCLISLPTGAGKSGVICAVGHFCSYDKVLVVTHRRAVCDQLHRQLKGKFFEKILPAEDPSQFLEKKVFNQINSFEESGVYCTTFQKITSLSEEKLSALKNIFGLVLIDEGHAEPSPKWGTAIREFESKKVIITATPYRNDLFSFDIDVNHSYIYSYKQAIDDKVIVAPNFETIDESNIVEKINYVRTIYPNAVCIIKCENFVDIQKYFNDLKYTFSTIAIHDQFKNDDIEHTFHYVPAKLAELNYEILIHQRKLDEGIDLPEAKILILTYPVGSGKELVQTIGRVVRVYENYIPFIFELSGNSNLRLWENYLEFDTYISNPTSAQRFLNTLNTASLIDSYLEAFPEHSYFDSCYRKKFNFRDFNPIVSLEIPLASVCFYYKLSDFSINDCLDKLHWEFNREGALTKYNEEIGVITSVCFNNSKFLKDSLFFEPSLEIMIVKELGDIVAIFDSRGRRFNGRDDLKIGRSIDLDKIYTVVATTNKTKTKQANSRALQTSLHRPEGIAFKSADLEAINHPQANSGYAVTTAVVSNLNEDDKIVSSYYLGVTSGRICDQKNLRFSYEKFVVWLDGINEIFETNKETKSKFLNSFAQAIDLSPSEDPVACILDFTNIIYPIEVEYNGCRKSIDNNFIYKKYSHGINFFSSYYPLNSYVIPFSISFFCDHEINNPFLGRIELFFEKDNKIMARCDENIKFYIGGNQVDLCELFNDRTIKLLYNNGVTFLEGHFYKFKLPTESQNLNQNLISKIISMPILLSQSLKEKDENNLTINNFSQNSIFNLIDKISNVKQPNPTLNDLGEFYQYLPNVDLVLCTDMGTEPADFILSSNDKLVFVHVKCGTSYQNPGSSAGAIFEVGSQALKNLHYLISNNSRQFANISWLRNPWPSINGNTNGVCLNSRIRLFNKSFDITHSLDDVLDKIDKRRVSTLVKKEIWIVVGNNFSYQHFMNQLSNPSNASPESIQAYQLLDTWLAQASNQDVDMKFFVSH